MASTAFSPPGVPLTCLNATDAMRQGFGWPASAAIDRRYEGSQAKATETWSTAVSQDQRP